jgi:lysophospholipid acyltransferase (LPLAT)-like uncharacterized protein
MVPKPFSRIRLAYADPVWIPRDADEPALTRIGAELGNTLDRLTAEVDHGG